MLRGAVWLLFKQTRNSQVISIFDTFKKMLDVKFLAKGSAFILLLVKTPIFSAFRKFSYFRTYFSTILNKNLQKFTFVTNFHCFSIKISRNNSKIFDFERRFSKIVFWILMFIMKGKKTLKKMKKDRLFYYYPSVLDGSTWSRWQNSNIILVRSWNPQKVTFKHPNVECFIGHSGLNSIQENIHYGKPHIAIALIADQLFNARWR